MNEIIKEQLKKCRFIDENELDLNSNHFHFNKVVNINPRDMLPNHLYLIRIKINPQDFSVLASNWNQGSIPRNSDYKCCVVERLGQMIKINGFAFIDGKDSIKDRWCGWLPESGVEVLDKLD